MPKKYTILLGIAVLITALFPQFSRAAATHLVISQVQIAGSSATDEFVELFNPTSDSVNLAGYRLTKKVASGTQSTLVASMSGTLAPNTYMLIKHPTGYTGSVIADTQYSTSSSITADNTVLLYSDAGITVVDKVGFGTPFEAETLAYPTNPVSGASIRRVNNNDTDNNSLDFETLTTSGPRNTSIVEATPTPITPPITPPVVTSTPSSSPTQTPTQTPTITPSPTESPTPTQTASSTQSPSPTESSSPSLTPSPTPVKTFTPAPTQKPQKDKHHKDNDRNHDRDRYEVRLPFGFGCRFERHEFEFKKHKFQYFKAHFHRR